MPLAWTKMCLPLLLSHLWCDKETMVVARHAGEKIAASSSSYARGFLSRELVPGGQVVRRGSPHPYLSPPLYFLSHLYLFLGPSMAVRGWSGDDTNSQVPCIGRTPPPPSSKPLFLTPLGTTQEWSGLRC